nr:immunoglobulin heavy chain junction region [Macaca mulatta]MOY21249.1 immunoglobulin heavy chain junction region [Macaca mulatta]MOY21261.1 immunoglobulin heavy chain junction region [Macaca mulatta]MOY21464.1 immunoglobulin heavy chain junction region [Macaca mulatta]MOY21514.1 immunoglobulin heavy chain junction region [Macaca mulatta]
CGRGIYFDYW